MLCVPTRELARETPCQLLRATHTTSPWLLYMHNPANTCTTRSSWHGVYRRAVSVTPKCLSSALCVRCAALLTLSIL